MKLLAFIAAIIAVLGIAFSLPAEAAKKPKKRSAPVTKITKKPLAKKSPSITKEYSPNPFFSPKMAATVSAYKDCMYGGPIDPKDPLADEARLARALELNWEFRDDVDLRGSPVKLGREVCLSDALGLSRFEKRTEFLRSIGKDLVEVKSPYIFFPDSSPLDRRYARPWVRDYLLVLAKDLRTHLLKKKIYEFEEEIPRLRVTSLIRSYSDQRRQRNSPASCRNEICSTHTTGSAADISNSAYYVDLEVRKWLEKRLAADRKSGRIVMIREYYPPHFHILVLPPEEKRDAEETKPRTP